MEKLNIVVLCGGESVESDISIITGVQVYNSLDANKYNKHLIYIDSNGVWWKCGHCESGKEVLDCKKVEVTLKLGDSNLFLIKGRKLKLDFKVHCAVLTLHGGYGENGTMQGILEMCKIPYTTGDNISCSVAMDKCYTKLILKGAKIKVLPFEVVNKFDFYENENCIIEKVESLINYPCIVKPSCLGSSIGITVAHNQSELRDAIHLAFKFDNKLLIEKALIDFTELNISARLLNGKVVLSEIEKPLKQDEILSFNDKYVTGSKNKLQGLNSGSKGMVSLQREVPAVIDEDISQMVKALTKKAYDLFNLKGIVRCDFLLDSNGRIYLNEINSIPGSLSFYLWGKENFSSVLDDEISEAIKRKLLDDTIIKKFESSVLQ